TVFITPDGAPFFGGTYYPPEPRHGLPSFRQLLVAVANAYRERREDVTEQAGVLVDAMRRSAQIPPSREPLERGLGTESVRELRLPSGGFASSQDADTDGVEGLTYTWTAGEGVPPELLQPFEHGRSIVRGELEPETRARLLAIRAERPQPALDDKVIASWN